ncbi:MAG: VCBS repeat-containing protein [Verrucomicrobia bacterium]|nr:VCBS repeat-containing protein [Verrucomicrobiota bacterium]
MQHAHSLPVSDPRHGWLVRGCPQGKPLESRCAPKHPRPVRPAFFIWLLAALQVAAEPPMLRPALAIAANGAGLDVGDYAIPCVADWNGDGRKDLLVGYRVLATPTLGDKVAMFLNTGTDTAPVFGQRSLLQANGADIQVPGSGCGAPAPWVCDYDGDGRRDLLVGEGNSGYVYLYRNTNTDAAPILAPGVRLLMGASPVSVSSRATPCVADWDADGLNDLLCGDGNGNVSFFRNVGTAHAPGYETRVLLQAGSGALYLGIRAVPRCIDWDGDGLQDLVGSSDTGVYWCRNTGTRTTPVLQAPVALNIPKTDGSGSLTTIQTGGRMRLDLTDWDGDGTLDLILGNANGTVFLYPGYRFRVTRIQQLSPGELTLEWASAPLLKYTVLTGSSPAQIQTPLVTGLASGGNLTTWTHPMSAPARYYRIQVGP